MNYYTMEVFNRDYEIRYNKIHCKDVVSLGGDMAETLEAFSHWTYDNSKHYLMIIGLKVRYAACMSTNW